MSVIRVQNLSKRFIIHHEKGNAGRYTALRDVIADKVKGLVREKAAATEEEFWALKDVNFDIEQGDRIGIIGRNGAGKSTLLKILSRITEPTSGTVKIKGRVASLLEVGTGFHPELTGRENIFLNGAILGMSRAEVKSKFDEIVAFAEIEKFLDTPVKRYSSGMYVRLAFAVAAHLEPEILIVDEVLAVGDAQFQKKCLGKMEDVSTGEGRTVLFVSHNMTAVRQLCTRGIYLKNGTMEMMGTVDDCVSRYLVDGSQSSKIQFPIKKRDVVIHDFLITQSGEVVGEFTSDHSIHLLVDFELHDDLSLFRIGFFIRSVYGELIARQLLADWDGAKESMKKGRHRYKTSIPKHFLTAGNYAIEVHTSRFGIVDYGTSEETRTLIQINAPSDFNPAHPGENSFGYILWRSDDSEFISL